jgi:hypothetical protein
MDAGECMHAAAAAIVGPHALGRAAFSASMMPAATDSSAVTTIPSTK